MMNEQNYMYSTNYHKSSGFLSRSYKILRIYSHVGLVSGWLLMHFEIVYFILGGISYLQIYTGLVNFFSSNCYSERASHGAFLW